MIGAHIPVLPLEPARQLDQALAPQTGLFHYVQQPDTDPYLVRNGLLFLDVPALGKLLDATIDAQPFLGQLAADPSARGLFTALGLIGDGLARGQANLRGFQAPLRGFAGTLGTAAAG